MIRHFVGLQSLFYTLHQVTCLLSLLPLRLLQAWKELGLIVLIEAITILVFSSLVFSFEQDGAEPENW